MEYYIPYELEPGRFVMEPENENAEASSEEYLHLSLGDSSILTYRHPVYGDEIRIYSVPEDVKIVAAYNEKGQLSQVSYPYSGDLQKLIYAANPLFMSFISITDIRLPKRILQEQGEVSRLFYEYFYDGDAVDFAVKLGTPADMEEIRRHYGADTDAVNNSGAYPSEKRMECDNHTFRILLFCTAPEKRTQVFYDTVRELMANISRKVLPRLNKTADFRVIDSEYD